MNDTTWSTLVGTWRPGRLELYVDGFSRASRTAAATSTSALFGIYRSGWGFSISQDFNVDIALIACEKAGCRARLVELDPKDVDVIIRRFQDYGGKAAILNGDGRSFEEIAGGRAAAAA